jgi:heme exporter protein A
MLSARGLTCTRGVRRLFTGLDLRVDSGEALHVRGENGTGKTSLLRIIAGLLSADSGVVSWNDAPITDDPDAFHRDLLFLGHHDAVKDDLTCLENLQFAAAIDGAQISHIDAVSALEHFGLKGREDSPVRILSAGQRRRVLLARLLTKRARLWILDEPFAALDSKSVDVLSMLIGEHLKNGGMAVVTSHQELPFAAGQALQL